ncbi:MAG TPA: CBS domain-containing protein [Solirubrobacteraceae bacterium]
MLGYDRSRAVAGAQSILDQGGWCMLELCVDVPAQRWEPRVVIFGGVAESVADRVADEVSYDAGLDARLSGCDRRTLRPIPGMGASLCYVADIPAPVATPASARPRMATRRHPMLVRDGMNPIVVTVGPDHTVREAARRMTAHGVGAAVVIDEQEAGPGIITERDVLHADGVGQDIDVELVRGHLTSEVVFAAADWSLERAAAAMVRGGFRHIIVLDGSDVVGILSMRDIVRCWISDGATCEVGGGSPSVELSG